MTTKEQVKPASPTLDEGDHERMAHIVTPASAVTEALVTGGQVTARSGLASDLPLPYKSAPSVAEYGLYELHRIDEAAGVMA